MTKQERDQFIEDNLNLVKSIANKFIESNTSRDFDDIFQEGCIGLIKAVDRFDPSKGFKFSTYAYRIIIGEIINNVNRKEEKTIKTTGLDAFVNGDEGLTIQDVLEDKSIGEYRFIEDNTFKSLLKALSSKRKQVIELRFFNGLTQLEASKVLGVSKQRISQIEKEALEKLKLAI